MGPLELPHTSLTHLAHPRLAFAHGLPSLHSLPQPPLACKGGRKTQCYQMAYSPPPTKEAAVQLAGFLSLVSLGWAYH
jgi:hypothetical protein